MQIIPSRGSTAVFLAVVLSGLGFSDLKAETPRPTSGVPSFDSIADVSGKWIFQAIDDFRARTEQGRRGLNESPRPLTSQTLPALRAELDTLRRLYKKFEFAVETLQPQCVEIFNAAPFVRLDEDETFKIEYENPQGLQVLEEEIYRTDGLPEKARVMLLLAQLSGAADQLTSLLQYHPPTAAMIWEAAENEVIRVLAMGLTGFDTPASGHGLAESAVALTSLRGLLAPFRPRLDAVDPKYFQAVDAALIRAGGDLSLASDFDGFDRLAFVRRSGNPLHASLVKARQAMKLGRESAIPGVTKADRGRPIPERAIAGDAKGLFSPGFLDKEFYALNYEGFASAPPTEAGLNLGQKLFFDPVLSGDNRRACASCHRPGNAYAEPVPRSAAFAFPGLSDAGASLPAHSAVGATGERNAPSLVYSAYQSAQFWDLRVGILEDQVGHVVQGEKEFNSTFSAIQAKLRSIPEYRGDFSRAFPQFGSQPIVREAVTSALAQYVRSLAGWNSPFDRYARGESDTLNLAARRGFNLFMGKAGCATCHFPPAFNGTVPPLYRETEAEVLGIPSKDDTLHPQLDADPGRFRVRPAVLWKGAFKTPTVRNVALTAPYMHNGEFATLESVVRFYNVGGGRGLGLEVGNQTLPPDSLGLSEVEQADLIAFMNSLTDDPLKIDAPLPLPLSKDKPELNQRRAGGVY